jgi:two-component system response regulator
MKSISVMLVEDNADDEELTLRTLRKHGVSMISVARDGYEALALLHGVEEPEEVCTPDVIFLDLRLPRIDGIDVLKRIRANERTKGIKIVTLSSSDDPRDSRTCEEFGVEAIFPKPLTQENLQAIFC